MYPSSLPQEYSSKSPPPSVPPQLYHQPPPPPHPLNVNWSSSLCACCSDVPNCCLTCWCPCIVFGQIAEIIDKGKTSCGAHGALYALIQALTCCGCMYSCTYRTKMRTQYGLLEDPCPDCLVHFFCEPCALCQEYRELKHRGFDISIGWQGNMERQTQGVRMPPKAHGGMYR